MPSTTTIGTSAIILWSPTQIIIGADGLLRHMSGRSETPLGTSPACKIQSCGLDVWAVIAGIYNNSGTGFDALGLIRQACADSPGDVDKAAEVASSRIGPRLRPAVEFMRAEGSSVLCTAEKAGTYLQFAIAGFVNGSTPVVSGRQFCPGDRVNVWECPGENDPAAIIGRQKLLLGEHTAFKEHDARHPGWEDLDDCAEIIAVLLQRQAELSPGIVGPPFSVLSIERGSEKWIQRR